MSTQLKRKKSRNQGGFLRDRRVYLGIGGGFLVVATPLLILLMLGIFDEYLPARVTAENYQQLQVGMKTRAVRKILGQVSWIDKSAVPRLTGHSAKHQKPENAYPMRFIWEDGGDVIWADIHNGRVVKFGATLDGQQFGADPDRTQIGKPEKPKEPEKKEPDPPEPDTQPEPQPQD
jgi:hypothetical protein